MIPNTPIPIQNARILEHLKRGPITPMEALHLYDCFQLAARIFDLREIGHEIITMRIKNPFGNYYAEYHLIKLAPHVKEAAE